MGNIESVIRRSYDINSSFPPAALIYKHWHADGWSKTKTGRTRGANWNSSCGRTIRMIYIVRSTVELDFVRSIMISICSVFSGKIFRYWYRMPGRLQPPSDLYALISCVFGRRSGDQSYALWWAVRPLNSRLHDFMIYTMHRALSVFTVDARLNARLQALNMSVRSKPTYEAGWWSV